MIQEFKTSKGEFALVKVPEDSTATCIETGFLFTGPSSNNDWDLHGRIELPEGNWQIIGEAFELTEEQIRSVVGGNGESFKNYGGKFENWFKSPQESFESVMSSLEIYKEKPDKCSNQWCEDGYIDMGYKDLARCEFCDRNEERTGRWILIKKDHV